MQNKVLLIPIIGALSFFTLFVIYTKVIGPIPFFINSVSTQKQTTFDVTGEGKVTVVPDTASVSVGIEANAATVSSAQDQINGVINKVSDAIKQLGVDPKDIQTTNYNINPQINYAVGNQKITGYTASTNLSIKVKELSKINQVLDSATSNGANQVYGVNFELNDRTKAENEARTKAVTDAKRKAENAASIAGFKLGKIVNYSENFGNAPRPLPMLKTADIGGVANSTQVEPGSTDVTVSVTLSYELQ